MSQQYEKRLFVMTCNIVIMFCVIIICFAQFVKIVNMDIGSCDCLEMLSHPFSPMDSLISCAEVGFSRHKLNLWMFANFVT